MNRIILQLVIVIVLQMLLYNDLEFQLSIMIE